jgi:membrane protease YdiL (CAAX protease family)
MNKTPVLQKFPVYLRIITFGMIIITSIIFVLIIGILLAVPFYGPNILSDLGKIETSTDPNIIALAKYFQIVSQFGMFIIPVVLFAFLDGWNVSRYLSINIKPAFKTMVFAVIAILAAAPLINYIGELNQHMKLPTVFSGIERWMKESEDTAAKLTDTFLNVKSTGGFLINLLMIGLIPAIGEEFMFRGVLQKLFHQWTKNIHFAVIFSAFLFSAMHMQFYGFVPRFLLGLMMGYIFVWSGSLWVPILIHFTNNSVAVLMSYLVNIGIANDSYDTIGTGNSEFFLVIISLVISGALIFLIYKLEKKKKMIPHDIVI